MSSSSLLIPVDKDISESVTVRSGGNGLRESIYAAYLR